MIALRSLIGPALIVGGCVAVFGAGLYFGNGMAEKRHQAALIVQQQAHAQALIEARAKEQGLQAQADQIKRNSDEKIALLNRRVSGLVSELRNRPERPASGVPESPGAEPARCTGAGLYRDDSEFLIRLAQDADATREALNQCKQAYEALQ